MSEKGDVMIKFLLGIFVGYVLAHLVYINKVNKRIKDLENK